MAEGPKTRVQARLNVYAHAGAASTRLEVRSDQMVHVYVTEPAKAGRANEAIVEVLSGVLGVAKSGITIVRGRTARHKVVAVLGTTSSDALIRLTGQRRTRAAPPPPPAAQGR